MEGDGADAALLLPALAKSSGHFHRHRRRTAAIDGYMREGKRATAQLLLRWLRALWTWADCRNLVTDKDAMQGVASVFKNLQRTDTFSDADLAAIWKATEGLTRTEAAAVKLLLLLAPRRTALSHMRWQDLDDAENPTLWVTPPEFTKTMATAAPRVYKTPLPEAAVAILKSLPQVSPYVFPSVVGSGPLCFGTPLKVKLVRHGAPTNLRFHTARHTLASFFEKRATWKSGCCSITLPRPPSPPATVTTAFRSP